MSRTAIRAASLRPVVPRVVWVVAAVEVLIALLQRWTTVSQARPVDLSVYLAGGQAVLHGDALYSLAVADGQGGHLLFTYPPFAALLFVPLALVGPAALAVLTALSLACYVLVVWICCSRARLGTPVAVLLTAAGLALEPVQRTLLFGQVNLLLLALVVLDALRVRGRWRGVLVGVAAGIKLTPAVVVVWFLLRREYRAAATATAAFASTVGLAWLVLPRDSYSFWFSAFGSLGRFGPEVRRWDNQAIGAVVDRATQASGLSPLAVALVTVMLSGSALALALLAARRAHRVGNDLAALVAVALGGLLVAPVTWTHHYVWVVPVLVVLLAARAWLVAGVTAVVFFLPPMWALAGRANDALGYSIPEVLLSAAWAIWAVGILGWVLLARSVDTRREVSEGDHVPSTRV
ncbi:glycosyltransferase 87 family protein [Phycicoccus sp. M110.8]|uniref:glycosyltransferase 87 family protein n=1 Tax=Phycicoccus sp. M110.8 TaxID=3075433 RepID=UPI0028FDAD9B|nr:glycosyltransferase 87 family protein [Phycicoccus sp. M110.8]MDU0312670.1 glycosyltransferase 87 family protein [Phycicoccus sp. M110.8]